MGGVQWGMNTATADMIECPKCAGAGRFGAFAHIESGTCFKCGGAGKIATPKERASRPRPRKTVTMPLDTVRLRLGVMRVLPLEHGEAWFDLPSKTGCGMDVVRAMAAKLPADECAAVLAEFETIRKEARRLDRVRAERELNRRRRPLRWCPVD